MGDSGLGAAIKMAARLSIDFPETEVLSFGRSATSDAVAQLEIGGRWLVYDVLLLSNEIRLSVALMDGIECPQTILRAPDNPVGWDVLNRLIRAMETHGVKSLARPIEVGPPGDDSFVIG